MNSTSDVIIDRSLARGARAAEVFVKSGVTRGVDLDPGGEVSWTRTAEGGTALRVFLDSGAVGFASVCGPEPDAGIADQLVTAALGAAHGTAPLPSLPEGPAADGRGLGIFDPGLHTATPSDLEGVLDDAAAEALRTDPRVRRLDSASIAASSSHVWLQNSAGFAGNYRQTLLHLSLGVVAEYPGSSFIYRQSRTARNLSAFSPVLFGDQVARVAATALDGTTADPQKVPVVLAPAASVELLRACTGLMLSAVPGDDIPSVSPKLTIIDDGRLPGGIASAPFDGEGVGTRRLNIVEKGHFTGAIHDLASAAVRVSFRDPPRRLHSNLFIAPGPDEPSDLISRMEEGLWIWSLRPTGAIMTDPSLFAAIAIGKRVENGQPVENIAGNLVVCRPSEILANIAGVGNDLTFGFPAGTYGSPSLLLENLEIDTPW